MQERMEKLGRGISLIEVHQAMPFLNIPMKLPHFAFELLKSVIVVTRGQFVAVFEHRLKHVNVKFIHNNEFD